MLINTTWKTRPLTPAQSNTMMARWAKLEADEAASPTSERISWYMNVDGSGGSSVGRVLDEAAAAAFGLELSLALSEFLEFDSKIVMELDDAMPVIMRAMERVNVG